MFFYLLVCLSALQGISCSYSPFPTEPTQRCSVKGSYPILDKCVLVESIDEMKWTDASWYCKNLGLKLLEITSGSFYFHLIAAGREHATPSYTIKSFWIGSQKNIRRRPSWCWGSFCHPIHDPFWAVVDLAEGTKEPIDHPSRNCALLDGKRAHFMGTAACDEKHGFICEGPLPFLPVTSPNQNPGFPGKLQGNYNTFFDKTEKDDTYQQLVQTCLEGWKLLENEGRCYIFMEKQRNFDHAVEYCEMYSDATGTLADITSQEENDFVKELIEDSEDNVWFGLRILPFGFDFLTGAAYNYSNWAPGEPKGKCTDMDPSTGLWYGEDCRTELGFVCEAMANATYVPYYIETPEKR